MISKFSVLEKYLNYFLLFIFPTQLAFHFWPEFAFVYGVRVDYLSPAIYLTDVVFLGLFLNWLTHNTKVFLKDIFKNRLVLFLILLFVIGNIVSSDFYPATIIKWLRIMELVCLGYYVKKRRDVFTKAAVSKTFFFSIAAFCLIGIMQVLKGHTLGGLFYWLGERTFSINTPGISLVNLFGRNHLRAYSTFPHPNSFAGFLGVALIYILFNHTKINKHVYVLGLSIVFLSFILTFSLGAFVGGGACLLFYLIVKKHISNKKVLYYCLIFIFLLSLYLLFFSRSFLESNTNLHQSLQERLELNVVAGKIVQSKYLAGTGLNTFFVNEVKHFSFASSVWFLQPVHNIFILVFVEAGILGLLLLYATLVKFSNKIIDNKDTYPVLLLFFVLGTSFVDHYWFTIYQNLVLLSFFVGLSLKEK